MQTLTENKLHIEIRENEPAHIPAIIALGRKKGYVTYDDILKLIPEAEQNQDWLENIFAALIAADIEYVEDQNQLRSDKEVSGASDQQKNASTQLGRTQKILDPDDLVSMDERCKQAPIIVSC